MANMCSRLAKTSPVKGAGVRAGIGQVAKAGLRTRG